VLDEFFGEYSNLVAHRDSADRRKRVDKPILPPIEADARITLLNPECGIDASGVLG
jgi:hypothetical protein